MEYKEIKGNLFNAKDTTYVHCISHDCALGAGIAKTFNQKYIGLRDDLKDIIKKEDLLYPSAIYIKYDNCNEAIINMITKEKCYYKPTKEDFKESLEYVRELCEDYDLKRLSMPKIGCGLDKLNWDEVREMIKEEFKDTDIKIDVYYF